MGCVSRATGGLLRRSHEYPALGRVFGHFRSRVRPYCRLSWGGTAEGGSSGLGERLHDRRQHLAGGSFDDDVGEVVLFGRALVDDDVASPGLLRLQRHVGGRVHRQRRSDGEDGIAGDWPGALARSISGTGMAWPKEMTETLMRPPHSGQCGSLSPASTRSITTPASASTPRTRGIPRCDRLPCSSTTASAGSPAAWWSPSMFCVTTPLSSPAFHRSTSARWAALGSAVKNPRLPAHLPRPNAGLGPVDVLVERELGRIDPRPHAVRSPEIGDPRFGRDPGPGEGEQALLVAEQIDGTVEIGLHGGTVVMRRPPTADRRPPTAIRLSLPLPWAKHGRGTGRVAPRGRTATGMACERPRRCARISSHAVPLPVEGHDVTRWKGDRRWRPPSSERRCPSMASRWGRWSRDSLASLHVLQPELRRRRCAWWERPSPQPLPSGGTLSAVGGRRWAVAVGQRHRRYPKSRKANSAKTRPQVH